MPQIQKGVDRSSLGKFIHLYMYSNVNAFHQNINSLSKIFIKTTVDDRCVLLQLTTEAEQNVQKSRDLVDEILASNKGNI